jgi:hypothetical protein
LLPNNLSSLLAVKNNDHAWVGVIFWKLLNSERKATGFNTAVLWESYSVCIDNAPKVSGKVSGKVLGRKPDLEP